MKDIKTSTCPYQLMAISIKIDLSEQNNISKKIFNTQKYKANNSFT